jgi:hypothetical protein
MVQQAFGDICRTPSVIGTSLAFPPSTRWRRIAMLRITTQSTDESAVLLKLEGKLLGPWVEELERSINGSMRRPNALRLDLSALTFADGVGIQVLSKLIRGGAILTACSGYIAALLHVEKP